MALPKATVQLQAPTKPLGATSAAAVGTVALDEEDEPTEKAGLINILSIVGFAAAVVVLAVQLSTASTWINAEDNPSKGEWFSQLSPL
jgi:hypothetical protein